MSKCSGRMGKVMRIGRLEDWRIGVKKRATLQPINFSTIFYIFLLNFIAISCYEPIEGCLDLRATNFAVDADDPCSNCCQFPMLKLAVLHKVYDAPLDTFFNLIYLDSVYQDGAGNDFRVQNIQFYISNLRFVRADGTEVPTQDSLSVEIIGEDGNAETVRVLDNFALANRDVFSEFDLGTFIADGTFDRIRFEVGIARPANVSFPAAFPADHPLAEENMFVNTDTGYIFNQMVWFNSANPADTTAIQLDIATEPFLRTVELPLEVAIIEGFDVIVTLQVNYTAWFDNVDLRNDDLATLMTKISDNLQNSFSVLAVDLE